MSIGILYVNTAHEGGRYISEAEKSCLSFKRFLPEAEYLLCTDVADYPSKVFDRVFVEDFTIPAALLRADHKNGQMVGKLNALPKMKHELMAYFGSDVYALSSRAPAIFDVLENFDLGVAHAPHRINTSLGNSELPMIPESFPEFNCDLIVWRNSEKVRRFLKKWRDMYISHELGHPHDQGPFRYLAYKSDLRIAVFPPEYNYRGRNYRGDTIILQNRDVLDLYLGDVRLRRKHRYKEIGRRLVSRARRLVG